MAKKISIINEAVLLVGATQISSLEDSSREALVAGSVYTTTYEELISCHPWTFSLNQVSLTRLVDDPLFGFDHAYQLPVDPKLIRLIRKNNPKNDYRLFEDKLYTDDDEVEIIYQFKPQEENLPSYFVRALVMELSKLFALSLIQDETQAQLFEGLAQRQVRKARNIDSQNQPSIAIDKNEFVLTSVR